VEQGNSFTPTDSAVSMKRRTKLRMKPRMNPLLIAVALGVPLSGKRNECRDGSCCCRIYLTSVGIRAVFQFTQRFRGKAGAFSYTPPGKSTLKCRFPSLAAGKPLSKLANTTKNQEEKNQ
jgi:hypothetical protein